MRNYQRELDALRERIAQRREDQAVLERLRLQGRPGAALLRLV